MKTKLGNSPDELPVAIQQGRDARIPAKTFFQLPPRLDVLKFFGLSPRDSGKAGRCIRENPIPKEVTEVEVREERHPTREGIGDDAKSAPESSYPGDRQGSARNAGS